MISSHLEVYHMQPLALERHLFKVRVSDPAPSGKEMSPTCDFARVQNGFLFSGPVWTFKFLGPHWQGTPARGKIC